MGEAIVMKAPIPFIAAKETSPGFVERLEHEYALKSELDIDWAARPVALTHLIALAEEGLLAFDPIALAWQWNIDLIRAKSDTDNVVDLMAGRLKRHSPPTHVTTSVAFWTQPIATAIDLNRVAFRTAIETGDLTSACFSMDRSVTLLFVRNDPLDAVWRESEKSLDFVRNAGFRDMADAIVSQQRFIATLQGRTATFSTFSDAHFDEATFEAQLTGDRTTLMICCFYWILKLKARFLSGDYAEALTAADKAKPLLWAVATQIQSLDYFYYAALTVAALYEEASDDEQTGWRDLLTVHREQLREWADNHPPTFGDKHALVSAEITRLEGRDADAMRLYEQAIRSAREQGFVQNEGLAHELAAGFYAARGIGTIAHACLRNARDCYLRWGAFGKVRQLEQLYPHLRDAPIPASPIATIGTPVEQLDVGTVLKAAQAVSSEIVLDKLRDAAAVRGPACRRRPWSAHPVPRRQATDRGGSDDRPRPG